MQLKRVDTRYDCFCRRNAQTRPAPLQRKLQQSSAQTRLQINQHEPGTTLSVYPTHTHTHTTVCYYALESAAALISPSQAEGRENQANHLDETETFVTSTDSGSETLRNGATLANIIE